jgi:hypothetical protein
MKAVLTIIAVVVAFISSAAYAGAFRGQELFIDFDNGYAEGTMWFVRSSDSDLESIGCSHKGSTEPVTSFDDPPSVPWPDGTHMWAWCQARDADDNHVICFTRYQPHLLTLRSISPFSYIRFSFTEPLAHGERECIRIDVSTQSNHLPLFKTK